MKNVCKICGRTFDAYNRQNVLCSAECKRINNREHQRRWAAENHEHRIEANRNKPSYKARLKPHYCTICGKLMERTEYFHKVRHDECVLRSIVEWINAGNKMTNIQYQQLLQRGYNIKIFCEEFADVLDPEYIKSKDAYIKRGKE